MHREIDEQMDGQNEEHIFGASQSSNISYKALYKSCILLRMDKWTDG